VSDNLYAIDVEKGAIICGRLTGKELRSSRDQIGSWNHWSELSVANGRVYIGTFDSVYCFGGQK
jgi:hypothetical protein